MTRRKKVTIQDIAQELNISFATVSNALGYKKGVSEEVRAMVFAKAKELGYKIKEPHEATTPSAGITRFDWQHNQGQFITYTISGNTSYLANSETLLSSNSLTNEALVAPQRIAVFLDSFFVQEIPSFYMEIYKHLAQYSSALPYIANLIPIQHNMPVESLDSLNNQPYDAAIIIGQLPMEVIGHLKRIFAIPFVVLDHYNDIDNDLHYIGLDSFVGMYSLVKDVLQRGYTDLCFVGSINQTTNILDRYLGYSKAMTECGLSKNIRYLEDRDFNKGPELHFYLPSKDELPQVFVCNCDKTASLVVRTLQTHNIKVPEDIGVIGFDDYRSQINSLLSLFTYEHSPEQLARLALKALMHKKQEQSLERSLFIEGKIVEGNSILQSYQAKTQGRLPSLYDQGEKVAEDLEVREQVIKAETAEEGELIQRGTDSPIKSNVKLQDIAKVLNTSTVTVSNALTGKVGVSEEMRSKIIATAQKMGYVPRGGRNRAMGLGQISTASNLYIDPLANVIQTGAGKLTPQRGAAGSIISVVVAQRYLTVGGSFYWELYQHIISSALNQGFTTTIAIVDDEQIKQDQIPDAIKFNCSAGIIALGPFDSHYLRSLAQQGIPCIQLDSFDESVRLPAVMTHNYINSYKMTHYLILKGHTEIGFVGSRQGFVNITDRFYGFKRAMLESQLMVNPEWILDDRDLNTGMLYQQLDLPTNLPSAFVCNCDATAYLVYSSLRSKGIKVPDDVSIVGYDNYLYGVDFAHYLTSINVNLHKLAQHAIVSLLMIIKQQPLDQLVERLECPIVERNSVKSLI